MKFILVIFLLLPTVAYAASPVAEGELTSGVGWRLDPFGSGKMEYHRGYDISCPTGTPVHPMQAGTISFTGPHGGYGNLVAVDHGNSYVTLYGHLSRILVRLGSKVTMDTVIALSGNTGRSTGSHLHFEVRRNGTQSQASSLAQNQLETPAQEQTVPQETWVDYQLVSAKAHQNEEKLLPGGWKAGM